jgi:hypothetical protein
MATPLERGYVFPGQPGAKRVSTKKLRRKARQYGLPAVAMQQISRGEANQIMNVQQPDPGDGMVGYGAFQFTPNAWGEGTAAMRKWEQLGGARGIVDDLDKQFEMARFLYKSAGNSFKPWYGTRYLTDRSGEGTLGPIRKGANQGSPGNLNSGPGNSSLPTFGTTPGVDNSAVRQSLLQGYLSERGKPTALLDLAAGLNGAQDIGPKLTLTPGTAQLAKSATSAGRGPKGASNALRWAESKVGFRESAENAGGLASKLNSRFGFQNAPWCAMFTSAAVTRGGAPPEARTASVAQVREKAAAKQGYRGFVNPAKAKAGDLILWGNDHIGMVESVKGGVIHYVAGNESDGVNKGTASPGEVDVVRPAYGTRRKVRKR